MPGSVFIDGQLELCRGVLRLWPSFYIFISLFLVHIEAYSFTNVKTATSAIVLDAMPNAFLVLRTVFFALLAHFHALILVFASWNIVTAMSSGMSAPGASVFLLLSSILTLVFVLIAYLAQLICARARPAHVRIECAWTVLMSGFQIAASIYMTVGGPPVCRQIDLPWAICASSSLLVHISWLATLIILSYCLTLCVASVAHKASIPDIWVTPVPLVPWFRPDAEAPIPVIISHLPTQKHAKSLSASSSSSGASCAVSKYIAERWEKLSCTERQPVPSGPILFTRGRQSVDSTRPTWARQQTARRGIDTPFAKPLPKRKEQVVSLSPPPRTRGRHVTASTGSRFVKASEELETTTLSDSTLTPRTPTVFPHKISDPDLPIPLPSLSEWIRADTVSVFTVDGESISSSYISCST